MSAPVKHLSMVQNWDCHARGTCCKEYHVPVSDEERQRIEAQGWDQEKDLDGIPAFERTGPPWARRYYLNHQPDGSCVFLNEEGRCRIHEKHGYETKPLPCRLFPFVLIPVADHWRVSLRYACPSAAENLGRSFTEHIKDLRSFADQLAVREKLEPLPDGNLARPPKLQPGQRVSWPDLLIFVDALAGIISKSDHPMEWRMRACLALARECQQADIRDIQGPRLAELVNILAGSVENEVPTEPTALHQPGWIGRVLFRQALAVHTRKDHGPKRGVARRGRGALLKAAWKFARGKGEVPRLHEWLPRVNFDQLEQPTGALPQSCEQILERYYLVKISSVQFCGPAAFNMAFWEGLEYLALTMPLMLWVTRAFVQSGTPAEEGLIKALSIIDDHVGFNPVLRTFRQRLSFRILSRRDEISRLIAWYSR